MAEPVVVHGFTEQSWRAGDGTPFAATLTIVPLDDDGDLEWRGYIEFDDKSLNFPQELEDANGNVLVFYNYWVYPHQKSGGTYLMNLLMGWHREIVALFGRVRAMQEMLSPVNVAAAGATSRIKLIWSAESSSVLSAGADAALIVSPESRREGEKLQ